MGILAGFLASPVAGQVITTFAGTDWIFPLSPLPAVNAPLAGPTAVAADKIGNVYVADAVNCIVARIAVSGTLTVVAGNGICGYGGDGGQAVHAQLLAPGAVAVFGATIFIGEYGRIRKVDANGIISTLAGNGNPGFSGDGGPAAAAQINPIGGLAVDGSGNLFLDQGYSGNTRYNFACIREIDGSGDIRTVAGNCLKPGFGGDGGPAAAAMLNSPSGIAFDPSGNLLIADSGNNRIRKVTPAGVISTVYAPSLAPGQGFPPQAIAADSLGNVFILVGRVVYELAPNGQPVAFAGSGQTGFSGDGGPATSAPIIPEAGQTLAVDASNNLIIADSSNDRVRKVAGSIINTIAGNGGFRYSGENVPAAAAPLSRPSSLALDSAGRLYVGEFARVQRIGGNGMLSTVAGNGLFALPVTGVPAVNAPVPVPYGLALDGAGDLFIADEFGLQEVNPAGIISNFAAGDTYNGLAMDSSGAFYATDVSAVYKVAANGAVTPIAGDSKNHQMGFGGDGGKAINALLSDPEGVAVDSAGKVYVADTGNNRVRVITPDGLINAFAGKGSAGGPTASGVPASQANLNHPTGLAIDSSGNIYIADALHIWKVLPDGTISIIAGAPPGGYGGDGGLATQALLNAPYGILLDAAGDIFIADAGNNRIREILATPPTIAVAPTALAFAANSGGATTAPQNLSLTGSIPGLNFSVSADSNWLTITPSNDRTPRLLQVTADPSNLQPGTYTATITVAPTDAQPSAIPVSVTFTVGPALPPQFGFNKSSFSFTYATGSKARSDTLTVTDLGGGQIAFTAAASTNSGGSWLSVTPASATALPNKPATLTITADPTGLPAGTYTGTIAIASSGNARNIPVVMTISSLNQAILLSQTGLSFIAVNSGGPVPPQSFAVLNAGTGVVNFSVTSSTLSGGPDWLSATPSSGTSDSSQSPAAVTVTVDGTNLAPGAYYGQVKVTAPNAANSPQVVTVFLDVLPAGSNPGALIQPSELVFAVAPGTGNPSSQNLQVFNVSGGSLSYRTNHTNGRLITALPGNATLPDNQPLSLVVQPTTNNQGGNTAPVANSDTLSFQFSDGRVQSVKITVVNLPGPAVAPSLREGKSSSHTAVAAICAPSQLMPSLSTLGQSFSVTAGWPVALGINVQDDCGVPLTSGSVTVNFSDGSPPISLRSLTDGTWQGTWQTQVASSASQVTLTINAANTGARLTGTRQVTGGFRSQQQPPTLTAASVVSASSPVSFVPLSPGGIISIFGTNLADSALSASSIPLPTQLGNAEVIVAGQAAPLLYVSDSQINAIVPEGVNTNTAQQVLVERGVTYSQPVPVNVAFAQPGVFQSGGFGIFVDTPASGAAPFIVTPVASATAGDVLVAYCAGLGPTTPSVTDGTASPTSPLANTSNPVTVTIGGQNASVFFAGLTPGFAGLYQINLVVPSGIQPGAAVPLTVAVGGQTSPPVSIAIR